MWFEGKGGGTPNPSIWVHAGPAGAHPMRFGVTQAVWDYVEQHGLDLRYNRRFVQAQLDAIQTLLESPPARSALASVRNVAEGVSEPSRRSR